MKAFRSPNGWAVELMDAEKAIEAAVLAEREACAKVKKLYEELIYEVGQKFPDETRHQTALRYIRQAERGNVDQAQCAAAIRSRGDK